MRGRHVFEGKIDLIEGLIFETLHCDGVDRSQGSHLETYRNGYILVRQEEPINVLADRSSF